MTRFLASVRGLSEAEIVLASGADIIDLKEPASGALGAVSTPILQQVVRKVAGRRPVSATIGDLPMHPEIVRRAVSERFDAGADYVKIGLFPGGDMTGTLLALHRAIGDGNALVAVLFADLDPQISLLPILVESGFAGVMLDTAGKDSGNLLDHASHMFLFDFVNKVHELGMFCGLAGSLQRADVHRLLPLKPDYLGFRGALCHQGRASTVDSVLTREMCTLVNSGSSNARQGYSLEQRGKPEVEQSDNS